MVRYFSPLYMDGRASSDIDAFPSCNNAHHRLLFALPLEHHDCGDRRLVPPAQRQTVRVLAREIDDTIGGFVRGQSALCLILAVFYAGVLHLIGLEHGALIGFAAGVIGFIPYVGSLLGLVVSTCIAIAQFWPNWTLIWLVPVVFFIGQSLGDYVLAPYLVSRRVHLNPVWVIFALYVFGYLFGFAGLIVAVPAAAAIGVVVRFALREYYASPLYTTNLPDSLGEISSNRRELKG